MRALIVAFLLLASTAHAQDSSGVSGESPSVKIDHPTDADNGSTDAGRSGFPVTIVETPEQTSDAAKRKQNTSEHDAADLDAQVRAANAAERAAATAERQEVPAWTQLIIGGASTVIAIIALVVSVWTFYRGNWTAHAQLRAYVAVSETHLTYVTDKCFKIHFKLKNTGQTPARNVVAALHWVGEPEPFKEEWTQDIVEGRSRGSLAAGGEAHLQGATDDKEGDDERSLTPEQCRRIMDGTLAFWTYGRINYDDVFGKPRFTNFRYKFFNRPAVGIGFHVCADGNDAD